MKTSELRQVVKAAACTEVSRVLAAEVIRLREALAKLHRVDSTEVPDVEGLLTEHDE